METNRRNSNDISTEQVKNARKLCEAIMSVPEEKRDIFTTVISAYTDGFIAGEAVATSRKS